MANVVIPLYFLSLCACLSFLIPATCGERVGFVITVQLAVAFATIQVEQEAAPSGDLPRPLLSSFVQYVIGTDFSNIIKAILKYKWEIFKKK